MNQLRRSLRLQCFCCVFVIMLWNCASGGFTGQVPAQKNFEIEEWATENYPAALDLAFANSCMAIDSNNQVWTTCIRIVPGFLSEMEYGLYLEKHYDGSLRARITEPRGESLFRQLCDFKSKNGSSTLPDLGRQFSLDIHEVDDNRLPALKSLASEFEQLRISPAPDDRLWIDVTKYSFRARSSSGNEIQLFLRNPGPHGKAQPNALIQWIEKLRSKMEGLGGKRGLAGDIYDK